MPRRPCRSNSASPLPTVSQAASRHRQEEPHDAHRKEALRPERDTPGSNIHPADELAALREEIKQLTARADELRDKLLEDGADLKGDQYTASIIPGVRETLDRKAIEEAFGEKAIAPFLKKTSFKTVKLVEN